MWSIALGAAFGAAQFVLLLVGVRSISAQKLSLPAMLGQFFCPLAALVLCAFLDRAHLLRCALILIGILLAGAVVAALRFGSHGRGNRKN